MEKGVPSSVPARPSVARVREVGLVFFALLAAFGAFALRGGLHAELAYDPGSPAENQYLSLAASAADVTAKYGGGAAGKYRGGDLASYLAAGEALLAHGGFEPEYTELWPPGMPVFIALVLAIFGSQHYVLAMVLTSVLLWALVMTFAALALRPARSLVLSTALVALPLLLPSLGAWTFGFGAVMSESLAHAAFVLALVVLAVAVRRDRVGLFALAGFTLGVATLVRAFFEFVGIALFGGAALALALAWLIVLAREAESVRGFVHHIALEVRGPSRRMITRRLACWLAAFAAFAGTVAPWRVYKKERFGDSRLVSAPPGYMFQWAWTPDASQPEFLHAANTACHADPKLCAFVEKAGPELDGATRERLVLLAMTTRPGRWLKLKVAQADWLWLGQPWAEVKRTPMLLVEGLLLALAGLVGLIFVVRHAWTARTRVALELAWVVLAVLGWNGLFFVVFQYEWRYSMPARVFSALVPILYLALRRDEVAAR